MIICIEEAAPKSVEAARDAEVARGTKSAEEDLPPPAYDASTTLQQPLASYGTPPQETRIIPPPANFVSIVRKDNSIRENFAINPDMVIPLSFLPALADGETESERKNLGLQTRDGSIDTEIWLINNESTRIQESGVQGLRRTALLMSSRDGDVSAKIHTTGHEPRPPFHLTISSRDGAVTLYLPRSFRGLLTITRRDGSVRVSESLAQQVTMLSDANHTRRCFVGDFSVWPQSEAEDGQKWHGDEVVVNVRDGRFKVQYENEEKKKNEGGFGGFFSRILKG